MADEAAVTLSASDEISAPVMRAVASLQQLQAAIDDISKVSKNLTPAAVGAGASLDNMGVASDRSIGSHRAAHQALALVTTGLADVAGASPAAQAGLRVVDTVMFQMAMNAGKVSLGFIGIAAAAIGVGVAMRSAAEDTKKEDEMLSKLVDTESKKVLGLNYLDATQKKVAAVAMDNIRREIVETQSLIDKKNELIKSNNASMKIGQGTGFISDIAAGLKDAFLLNKPNETAQAQAAAQNQTTQKELAALQEKLKGLNHEYGVAKEKASAYHSTLKDGSDPLKSFAAGQELAARDVEEVSRIVGDLNVNYDSLASAAARAGISVSQAAQVMVAQNQAVKNGIISVATAFGDTLGNAIMNGKNAWLEGLKAMVGAVFDAATQVLIAAAIMNEGLTAALIPGTFGGIIAMVAVVQALKAVAMSALSSAASTASTAAPNAVSALSNSAGAPTAATTGATGTPTSGGAAVGSANQTVTNHISVNLGVQAIDLSGISDSQLKNLAGRIGRILSDSAYTGQISFAGA